MTLDRDDLIRRYEASRKELLESIEGLSEAQSVERTFDGWSLKDHLVHLATWDEVRATEVDRISAGFASAWKMTEEEDAAFNEIATRLRWDLTLEQVRWELGYSRRKLLDALARATPRGLDPNLYGEAGLNSGHEAEHVGWIRAWRTRMAY